MYRFSRSMDLNTCQYRRHWHNVLAGVVLVVKHAGRVCVFMEFRPILSGGHVSCYYSGDATESANIIITFSEEIRSLFTEESFPSLSSVSDRDERYTT